MGLVEPNIEINNFLFMIFILFIINKVLFKHYLCGGKKLNKQSIPTSQHCLLSSPPHSPPAILIERAKMRPVMFLCNEHDTIHIMTETINNLSASLCFARVCFCFSICPAQSEIISRSVEG